MKVKTLVKNWLKGKSIEVKESTIAHYSNMVTNHVVDDFGELELNDVMKDDNFFIDYSLMKKKFLDPKSLQDLMVIIKSIFNYAFDRGYIDVHANIIIPTALKKEVAILLENERIRLEEYLAHHLDRVNFGILFTLYSGLRIGELCALKTDDIILNGYNSYVKVNKTVQRIKNLDYKAKTKTKIIIDVPKTKSSNRVIPIQSVFFPFFQEYCNVKNSYLLTGSMKLMEPRLMEYHFKKITNTLSLNQYNFHVLRHSFATRALTNGVDVKTLSEILGHSDVKQTLEIYCHSDFNTKCKEMNRITNTSNSWGAVASNNFFVK